LAFLSSLRSANIGNQAYMQTQPGQTYTLQTGHDPRFAANANFTQPANNDMHRLEALVAVATSENRAVERS
jgi:C2H2 transcription facotor